MLLFIILKSFFTGKKFELNNNGNHYRDFTYIDDAINLIFLIFKKKMKSKNEIFNICSKNTIFIKKLIGDLKKLINIKFININKNNLDVFKTNGDNKKVKELLGLKRNFTKIEKVLPEIISWYKKNKIYKLK